MKGKGQERTPSAFRIRKTEALHEELRRILLARLERARRFLGAYPREDAEGLHEARKDIKRLRSLLRLLRLPEQRKQRRRANKVLRMAARRLSGRRDTEVLGALLGEIAAAGDPALRAAARHAMQQLPEPSPHAADLSPEDRGTAEKAFSEAENIVAKIPLQKLGKGALLKAWKQREKRRRRARKAFCADPSPENLHELRKRLKDSLYQRKLLRELLPKGKRSLKKTRRREKALGKARDYDLLAEFLGKTDGMKPAHRERLFHYIRSHSRTF
mgnify:CR=1 FL=1